MYHTTLQSAVTQCVSVVVSSSAPQQVLLSVVYYTVNSNNTTTVGKLLSVRYSTDGVLLLYIQSTVQKFNSCSFQIEGDFSAKSEGFEGDNWLTRSSYVTLNSVYYAGIRLFPTQCTGNLQFDVALCVSMLLYCAVLFCTAETFVLSVLYFAGVSPTVDKIHLCCVLLVDV